MGWSLGEIGINLYGKEVPYTVDNFAALCEGTRTNMFGTKLAY